MPTVGMPPVSIPIRKRAALGTVAMCQVCERHDRRVKVLQLTEKSKTVMKGIRKLINESETVMTKGLSSADGETLSATLDLILNNLESAIDEVAS